MSIPPACAEFWVEALRVRPALDAACFLEAFAFGDNARLAHDLAERVLRGVKRATASLAWTYEHDARRMPRPTDLSIVTDWAGVPLCIIETTVIQLVPFDDVEEAFARAEGEGDGSLESWRREHGAYFARECERIARAPSGRMLVVCEQFDVVYQR